MAAPLIPQEIYMLERYSSLEYFGQLRDEFAACVKAAENALAKFMRHLPPDYRKRPLHEQPDAVWGERILPNMRWALDGLNTGYIRISHGDLSALGLAGNINTTFTGIIRDYDWEWMPKLHHEGFEKGKRDAWGLASNISFTADGDWSQGDLTVEYTDDDRGPLSPPPSWPKYRLNPKVRVRTNDKVPRNGIYLPDDKDGCAELLIEGYEAWQVTLPSDPNSTTPVPRSQRSRDTTWTLVERIADSGGGVPGAPDPVAAGVRLRCQAGQPCPASGFWFSPARQTSRRSFTQGELMPEVGGDYGTTIWQWDEQQA